MSWKNKSRFFSLSSPKKIIFATRAFLVRNRTTIIEHFVSSHQPQLVLCRVEWKYIRTSSAIFSSSNRRFRWCQKRLPLINRWNEIMERWLHIQNIYIFACLALMHKFIKKVNFFLTWNITNNGKLLVFRWP